MKKTIVLAATTLLPTFAFGPPAAQAAVAEVWVQRYNGPANSNDSPTAVAVDTSGNVVVTGISNNGTNIDYYTSKYAVADGALLWAKRYNGPPNRDDYARSVVVDGGGNVIVTGHSYKTNGAEYYTAKYATSDGALLWEKRSDGPTNENYYASAAAVDASGNVVVTSIRESFAGWDYGNSYTAKYAALDGALLWEHYSSIGGGEAVALDDSGNVVVHGYYGLIKLRANGTEVWTYPDEGGVAFALDSMGNPAVITAYWTAEGNYAYYTTRYGAEDGALLWRKHSFSGNGRAVVALDGNGNVAVSATSNDDAGGENYYTAKYAASDGALLWEKRYNGPGNLSDIAFAMAVDGNGNVVVTGTTDFNDYGTNSDFYTAKYAAADGALLWEKRYNGPANGFDLPAAIALGPDGMAAVVGTSSDDYVTIVYWQNLPAISIERVPTGIRLRFTGISGRSYTIERAPAVTGPWTTLDTQTAPASGVLEYIDTAPPPGSAFYRTVQP